MRSVQGDLRSLQQPPLVQLAVRAGVTFAFRSEPTLDDEALDRFLAETRDDLRIHSPASPLVIDPVYEGLEVAL